MQEVSNEVEMNITNYGNIIMNLSLEGYGLTAGDENSMFCETGNISIEYKKFNLTTSNSSNMTLQEFEENYQNFKFFTHCKKIQFRL